MSRTLLASEAIQYPIFIGRSQPDMIDNFFELVFNREINMLGVLVEKGRFWHLAKQISAGKKVINTDGSGLSPMCVFPHKIVLIYRHRGGVLVCEALSVRDIKHWQKKNHMFVKDYYSFIRLKTCCYWLHFNPGAAFPLCFSSAFSFNHRCYFY